MGCRLPILISIGSIPQIGLGELWKGTDLQHAAQLYGDPSVSQPWHDLVELITLDPTLELDIRYGRHDNFMGRPVYDQARAFLQRPAAEALVQIQRTLVLQGYGLLIFDGYRPWSVTRLFWDELPEEKHLYVADPARGSRHNRGCAVDLTLIELETKEPVPMPTEFDEMSERAHLDYAGCSETEGYYRELLQRVMTQGGFLSFDPEWWHFDHPDWPHYPILDLPFAEL